MPKADLLLDKHEPRHDKTSNVVFEQVQHKWSCTSTEDGQRLEILDLESRGGVVCVVKTKALISFTFTDLRLCFRIMQNIGFLMTRLICYD